MLRKSLWNHIEFETFFWLATVEALKPLPKTKSIKLNVLTSDHQEAHIIILESLSKLEKIVLIIVIYWYIMVSLNNTSASSMKIINPTDNTTKIIKSYLIIGYQNIVARWKIPLQGNFNTMW